MNSRSLLNIVFLVLIAGVLLCAGAASSATPQEPAGRLLTHDQNTPTATRRVALVIGNSAYANAPFLKNARNDAEDMAATLTDLGFKVVKDTDVGQRQMKTLIREFGQNLKAGGMGLFYFAGHGVQSKGRNFLIPVDADIRSEAEVEDASVDVNLVLNYMDDAQNDLNVVILDACRNNPFARAFRSATAGLAYVDAPTGTLIAYATAPGRVASDGAGRNGLYTAELLKQMRVPGLSLPDLFMRVRGAVMKQTANQQVPWEASSLLGTFSFVPTNGAAIAVTRPAGTVGTASNQLADGGPVRKRGAKSGKILYWPGVVQNEPKIPYEEIVLLLDEFNRPLTSSLESVGLTVVSSIASRDFDQVLGVSNSLYSGKPSTAGGLTVAVYLSTSILVRDLGQYSMYTSVCSVSFRLIDLEEGKIITTYETGERKGYGSNKEQARRNALREAGTRIPQTFINQIRDAAW